MGLLHERPYGLAWSLIVTVTTLPASGTSTVSRHGRYPGAVTSRVWLPTSTGVSPLTAPLMSAPSSNTRIPRGRRDGANLSFARVGAISAASAADLAPRGRFGSLRASSRYIAHAVARLPSL